MSAHEVSILANIGGIIVIYLGLFFYTKNFLLNRIVIKIAFGFITGLILSFVFYKLIEKTTINW